MFQLRPANNQDCAAVIELIAGVYAEYGDKLCLDGAEKDLNDLEASYQSPNAEFVVMLDAGTVVGSHAVQRIDDTRCTFRRLYLRSDYRGTGAGDQLFEWAIQRAQELGFVSVFFWSDTRFTRAHQFFLRHGFNKGETRQMFDSFEPYSEFAFRRSLSSMP